MDGSEHTLLETHKTFIRDLELSSSFFSLVSFFSYSFTVGHRAKSKLLAHGVFC